MKDTGSWLEKGKLPDANLKVVYFISIPRGTDKVWNATSSEYDEPCMKARQSL